MAKKCFLYGVCLILLSFSIAVFARPLPVEIEVVGVQNPVLQNVEGRLAIAREKYHPQLTSHQIDSFLKNAATEIKAAMEPYGFFHAKIRTNIFRLKKKWIIHFNIQPGPTIHIVRLTLSFSGPGAHNQALLKLHNTLPITAGNILLTDDYATALQTIYQAANNQGYINATFTHKEIRIDLKKNTAVINLALDTGEQYYFGTLTFAANPLSTKFLKRFTNFNENEPFSSQKLQTLQENLNASHYFNQVKVVPNMTAAYHHKIPVQVDLTAVKARQYNLGLGFGTATGPRLTLGGNWRRVNDSGQNFNAQLKLSSVITGLASQYVIPGQNPLTDQYVFGAKVQKFKPKNGHSFSQTLSISHVKAFGDWKRTVTLSAIREHYYISTEEDPPTNSMLLMPTINFSRVVSDNAINPTSGSKINFTLQGATTKLLSKANFLQSELDLKYICNLHEFGELIFVGDLGYTVVSDLYRLPLSLRFLTGGLGSIRGFKASSIGPGRYLKVGSIEYKHTISGNWSGSVFYDAGTADDHVNAPLQRSVGVGLIYASPIGAIRVYVSRPQTIPGKKPFRLDFSLGPDL